METTILNGKQLAAEIQQELKLKVEERVSKGLKVPHLAAILVGEHAPSLAYVNGKVKACAKAGFKSTLIRLPEDIAQDDLIAEVDKLNHTADIDGFIVQLPLPRHINEQAVILSIDPKKDVDGFHPENVGRMTLGLPGFVSATPAGIVEMLRRFDIPTEGKHCVVLGRSNIVGMPMSILMSQRKNPGNCTVTIAHSRTQDLKAICSKADILIAAIGKAAFITADIVKPGAIVIDVGINRVEDPTSERGYRLVGDVDFEGVSKIASAISPVPGGVGPMTIISLMMNTYKAATLAD